MKNTQPEATDDRSAAAGDLRKGQVVTVKIASLAPGGEGVSRDLGKPIFVNRVAPEDVVEVELFDVRKDFARGQVLRIVEPSAVRMEPPCKVFKVCGGCQWQHINYDGQLEYKADIVRQAIKHIAKLDASMVLPTIGAADPLYYRNKAQFPVESVSKTGRILAGYYEQNSHKLVNIKHCPVQPEPLDRALAACKDAMETARFTAYDEKTGKGLIRHIAERFSFAFDKVLLTIVINKAADQFDQQLEAKFERFAETVMRSVPEVIGVCINFNTYRGNRIMGDTTRCIAGEGSLVERLQSQLPEAPEKLRDGILFRLSPTSFFQVNSRQAQILLDQVLLAAVGAVGGGDARAAFGSKIPTVIDAYAGVGTMAMWLAPISERVIAIEEMDSSVRDGARNCQLNELANVEFIKEKVESAVPKLLDQGIKPDVVVVDPPRKGLDPHGLSSIAKMQPSRIVYVSCNPATLARDLKLFEAENYRAVRIQPVDMFPQTYHVESVTLLEKC